MMMFNCNNFRSMDVLFIVLMIGFSYVTKIFIDVVTTTSNATTNTITTNQYSQQQVVLESSSSTSGKHHQSQVQQRNPPPQHQPSKSSTLSSYSSSTYNVTFINRMMNDDCDLYWVGNVPNGGGASLSSSGSSFLLDDVVVGGPKIYYGPIVANGGTRTIEGYPGQTFALLHAGTYQRLGTYTIQRRKRKHIQKQQVQQDHAEKDDDDTDTLQQFILTDENKMSNVSPPKAIESSKKQQLVAAECRLTGASSCEECMKHVGCGWSPVRQKCFVSHPIGTFDTVEECYFTSSLLASPNSKKSISSWIDQANELLTSNKKKNDDDSTITLPKSIRQAYLILQHAAKMQDNRDTLDWDQRNLLHVALSELASKLDTVFDDQDAKELLEKSRHTELAKIHPSSMPIVDRRTLKEAKYYISQGLPVVITDIFSKTSNNNINVVHQWTLEYLYRNVFSSDVVLDGINNPDHGDETAATAEEAEEEVTRFFNVATDIKGKCCQYFESQSKSKSLGYPYPFTPTTHLYRDKFDGFVNTIRKHLTTAADETNDESNHDMLHYLHEIVMNSQGEAVVAGGPAPKQLKQDLESIVSKLQPIANDQPFFGGFASAKLWIGQKGIVMPLHYDATDNMYVMVWGRKRAIIGPPGQLDTLYRYPNNHPLVGSSQINLTAPDLTRFPRFQQAQLQEVVVGPGDVLYLPAWWWHQFEQPFEDTAALNLWSRDRDQSPDPSTRDKRIREHSLYDHLERSVVQLLGNQTGIVLDALAHGQYNNKDVLETLNSAAEQWQQWVTRMPGGHPKTEKSTNELVSEFLETQLEVLGETRWQGWKPGMSWDVSQTAVLPSGLSERCESAPASSPFLSYCA